LIICARNARAYLEQSLEILLSQDYPEYELILVDDSSDDDTESWILAMQKQYPILKYHRNLKTMPGKKQALILGISKALYSWIVLTDADCKPGSELWLKSMMSNVKESTKIVLGYSPYEKKSGLLNKLIRLETLINAIQYLSAAKLGFPYMGCGRNLVYHKSIFDTQSLRLDLAYGDDDLLIHARATKDNTVGCVHRSSFVYSIPATNYIDYFKQKWRHYAAAREYSLGTKTFLFIYFMSLIGFYCSFVALLFLKSYAFAFGIFMLKIILAWPQYYKHCNHFGERDLIFIGPFLECLYAFHLIIQIPFLWIKKKEW
jgi:cellulose synthase/poly-beta-1,6-N-acetylglucosamine synthase-like glycosyltransferase